MISRQTASKLKSTLTSKSPWSFLTASNTTRCAFCETRYLTTSTKSPNQKRRTAPPTPKNAYKTETPPAPLPAAVAPIRDADGALKAKPLMRPIGVKNPPQVGENSEFDDRTWLQRNPQWTSLDRKLEYRKKLESEFGKSYFQDFKDMRYDHGKSFIAPPKLFRSTASLYFPNITGRTLISPDVVDSTALFDGRVSVVTYTSSKWALEQLHSWTSVLETTQDKVGSHSGIADKYVVPGYIEQEDDLYKLLDGDRERIPGTWQFVDLNIEENWFKSLLLRMSMGGIKKTMSKERWARYIHVRKGLTEEWKRSVGVFNQRVAYVWLVDAFCRIRWAGSGVAHEDEKEAFVKGLRRLVDEEEERRAVGSKGGKTNAKLVTDKKVEMDVDEI